MKTGYFVETWDVDEQEFTPQAGVPRGPWSLWGLRQAILGLRALGYPANYDRDEDGDHQGDSYVSIWSEDLPDNTRLRHKLPWQCREWFRKAKREQAKYVQPKPLAIAEGT